MKPPKVERLVRRAFSLHKRIAKNKDAYQKLDAVLTELMDHKEDLPPYGLLIVDNFADRNTVFRPAGVKRFEFKFMPAEKPRRPKITGVGDAIRERARAKGAK